MYSDFEADSSDLENSDLWGPPAPRILTHHQVVNTIYGMSTDNYESIEKALSRALLFPTHLQQPPRQTLLARGPSGTTTTLVMPCTYNNLTSVKTVSIPAGAAPKATLTLHHATTGSLRGVISADELTAFRTALVSILLLRKRAKKGMGCKSAVIFGTGRIAYWTSYLLTVWSLDGSVEMPDGETKIDISIVGRGTERQLAKKVSEKTFLDTYRDLKVLNSEGEEGVKAALVNADAVFCCTPSTSPLFPGEWLDLEREGRMVYISLIGSYTPAMKEIEPSLLLTPGIQVVVDQKEACLAGAGELIDAGLKEADVEEIGQVLRIGDMKEVCVFKCVGLAVMDCLAGEEVLTAARMKGRGWKIKGYEEAHKEEDGDMPIVNGNH